MKAERELVLYASEVRKYILSINASDDEKRKISKALADFMIVLKERNGTWPIESDYAEYRDKSKTTDKTTTQNISRIKRFFLWQERENAKMIETGLTNNEYTDNSTATVDTQPESTAAPYKPDTWPDAQAEKPKAKPGRKIISANGQKKTEKLMLYLTPETITDLRDWCRLKGISAVSYITALIEEDLHSKADKINTFRKLSKDA